MSADKVIVFVEDAMAEALLAMSAANDAEVAVIEPEILPAI